MMLTDSWKTYRTYDRLSESKRVQMTQQRNAPFWLRFLAVSLCLISWLGCRSSQLSQQEAAHISNALKKQITVVEARQIVLEDLNHQIQQAQTRAATNEASREVLEVLAGMRTRRLSQVENFLSKTRDGDSLWTYQTRATIDRGCRENGLAIVRDGRAVSSFVVMIWN